MASSHQVLVLASLDDASAPQEVVEGEVRSCVRELVAQLMMHGGVFHFVSPAAHAVAPRELDVAETALVFHGRIVLLEVRHAVSEPLGVVGEAQQAVEEVEGALEYDGVAQRSHVQRALMIVFEDSSGPETALAQRRRDGWSGRDA